MSEAVVRLAAPGAADCQPMEDVDILTEVLLALVRHPDQVQVVEKSTPEETHFMIHVAPEDLGKVIGKRGETVWVLRNLFGRIAAGRGRKAYIQIDESNKIKAA